MWVEISDREKCVFLKEHRNTLYTVPDTMELEYNLTLRSEADVTFYDRESNVPQILIKKGWNGRGLWEETYWKWKE